MTLGATADAQNAIKRLYDVFEAETISEDRVTDEEMKSAIVVTDGHFTWDSLPPEGPGKQKKGKSKTTPAVIAEPQNTNKVFGLSSINLTIAEGHLTAIVGPVGTGKTSLLEAMIGEMRKTSGTVKCIPYGFAY